MPNVDKMCWKNSMPEMRARKFNKVPVDRALLTTANVRYTDRSEYSMLSHCAVAAHNRAQNAVDKPQKSAKWST